ncbi:hypothetical protein PLICRDRAFT_47446 [Plicaturopsis crispa FD-325 SS-3]|uniref:Uncharacterized protein n=1 Tax=Plicaturopsis crispa FD-325 SS-3 TaxID=944288 RepID=A0A0C9T4K1_PLICR|nr:hypothetical protein PLICRDRAFT_47446 [Plicaturopsis crispa FD-325 SS-3]
MLLTVSILTKPTRYGCVACLLIAPTWTSHITTMEPVIGGQQRRISARIDAYGTTIDMNTKVASGSTTPIQSIYCNSKPRLVSARSNHSLRAALSIFFKAGVACIHFIQAWGSRLRSAFDKSLWEHSYNGFEKFLVRPLAHPDEVAYLVLADR